MSPADNLVVFTLDSQPYALRLSAVERAVRMVEITPLPHAPSIVLGVMMTLLHAAVFHCWW